MTVDCEMIRVLGECEWCIAAEMFDCARGRP